MSPSQTSTPQGSQTVNSFSLRLEGFEVVLRADQPIEMIEEMILAQLENPVRLLRWAIVRADKKTEAQQNGLFFWCEGAYLKTCQ